MAPRKNTGEKPAKVPKLAPVSRSPKYMHAQMHCFCTASHFSSMLGPCFPKSGETCHASLVMTGLALLFYFRWRFQVAINAIFVPRSFQTAPESLRPIKLFQGFPTCGHENPCDFVTTGSLQSLTPFFNFFFGRNLPPSTIEFLVWVWF